MPLSREGPSSQLRVDDIRWPHFPQGDDSIESGFLTVDMAITTYILRTNPALRNRHNIPSRNHITRVERDFWILNLKMYRMYVSRCKPCGPQWSFINPELYVILIVLFVAHSTQTSSCGVVCSNSGIKTSWKIAQRYLWIFLGSDIYPRTAELEDSFGARDTIIEEIGSDIWGPLAIRHVAPHAMRQLHWLQPTWDAVTNFCLIYAITGTLLLTNLMDQSDVICRLMEANRDAHFVLANCSIAANIFRASDQY